VRFGEGHDALAQLFEFEEGELPAKRVTHDLAGLPARAPASLIEQLLEVGIEIDGNGFHDEHQRRMAAPEQVTKLKRERHRSRQ
jgi:hypothetical protein